MEPEIVISPTGGKTEVWTLPTDENTLHRLLADTFTNPWPSITFGPLIQGAAYEFRCTRPPDQW